MLAHHGADQKVLYMTIGENHSKIICPLKLERLPMVKTGAEGNIDQPPRKE